MLTKPLSVTHPDLARGWHTKKNGDLKPSDVTAKSQRKVWWICDENRKHEWRQVVYRRLFRDCPLCKKESKSLAALYPEVAAQWHPTKNGKLTPEHVAAGCAKKFWWQCDEDPSHVFDATAGNRTGRQSGCPYCAGRKVNASNSLASLRPDIASEWHPRLNNGLTPNDVTCGSEKVVWWLCSRTNKHEWKVSIDKRTIRGQGCPTCRRVTEENSLATLFPELAEEWHPTKNRHLFPSWDPENRKISPKDRFQKNRRITPADVAAYSKEYVWWQCKKSTNHEWYERVGNRTSKGLGCPFCAGCRIACDNNLAAKEPAVAKLWHPTRNLPLTPADVTSGNAKVVWWRCFRSADHIWQAPIVVMVRTHRQGHTGCPFCCGRRAGKDNNLAKKYPAVAELWHPTRNGDLLPTQVTPGSGERVWWKCITNPEHVWQATVSNVTRARRFTSRGCPFCSGHRVAKENSLHSKYPQVAAYWDKSRNLSCSAKQVTYMSNKEVFWRCSSNHVWSATVCYTVTRFQKGWAICRSCK